MKKISVLGSTGSVGVNTLRVVESLPGLFRIVGLSAKSNMNLLKAQTEEFKPKIVAVGSKQKAKNLKKLLTKVFPEIVYGEEGLLRVASFKNQDLIVIAISGSAGLLPTLEAIKSSRQIALANKECLVMAGHIIRKEAQKRKVLIIPLDSEHNAIFQCLKGVKQKEVKKLIITGSGGPLWKMTNSTIKRTTVKQALNHPKWKMGKKISVDSATLMNKGLEVIEARWLFDISPERIQVLIHPEAVIHSMVEFVDSTIAAIMGINDMRLPIQYALTYPKRIKSNIACLDFCKINRFKFLKPDFKKFPALKLAYLACQAEGSFPCVLNASNEEAVSAFLDKRIGILDIATIVEKVLNQHKKIDSPVLSQILKIDTWTRRKTKEIISNFNADIRR